MYDKYVEKEVLQKLFRVLLRLFRTLYIVEKHRERENRNVQPLYAN